ncbi:MAG: T9SS type A sorting domain-containing protein, partial [Cytophagaceae bacterium]|nr:T9SS type A sorting domain-containing protein [Cytophagaceae bacterium]
TGFVSNWCDPAGTPNTCGTPAFNDYGYDAARNPWRMATDYIWNGEAQARTNFNQLISNYVRTQTAIYTNPNNLRGPVTLAGAFIGGRTTPAPDATFTSTWATACMGVDYSANNQATLDFMYNRTKAVKDPLNCTAAASTGYFGNTLRVISLFMMTGNFWKPCEAQCAGPAFAADSISTCGPNSVTLNSGIATGGAPAARTFQWYKNGTSLGGANTTANTLVVNDATPAPFGPGWFRVVMNDNGCIQRDSIYVSSTSITPALGQNIQLCAPTNTTLDSKILGTGYTFVWEYASNGNYANLAVIPGEVNSTLAQVRRPGLYKVTASKGGCVAKWDTMRVTSLLASPQDACFTGTPPGSVTLSVVGPNLNAATNYDWYNVPIGGAILAGGTGTYNYTTPSLAAGIYTYYIQDKSRVYGKVGKTRPTNPPASNCGALPAPVPATDVSGPWWGIDDDNVYFQTMVVNRTINIDSVTVYFCLWNNTDLQSTVFVLTDNAGTTAIQTTAARPVVRYVDLPASFGPPYDGRVVGARFFVGINAVAPGTYKLKAMNTLYTPANAFANMLLEQHPTNVNYVYKDNLDGNTVSITNSHSNTYTTTYYNRYAHFYDWTISAINNCDRIPVYAYIGSANCPVALPVVLISFKGRLQNGKANLEWITSEEKNASYFIVTRSSDGINFNEIGRVAAEGNSDNMNHYKFTDYNPLSGTTYYRIQIYDQDGSNTSSYIIAVDKVNSSGIELYPNPGNSEVTIKTKEGMGNISSIVITDLMGREVRILEGDFGAKTVSVTDLSPGTYIFQVIYDGNYEAVRFVKNDN